MTAQQEIDDVIAAAHDVRPKGAVHTVVEVRATNMRPCRWKLIYKNQFGNAIGMDGVSKAADESNWVVSGSKSDVDEWIDERIANGGSRE